MARSLCSVAALDVENTPWADKRFQSSQAHSMIVHAFTLTQRLARFPQLFSATLRGARSEQRGARWPKVEALHHRDGSSTRSGLNA
jgi:hypothetical protein